MPHLEQKYLQIADLLSHYIDGLATNEQQRELQALLLSDESLRRFAARWLIDEFLLSEEQKASLATQFFQGSEMLPGLRQVLPDESLAATKHMLSTIHQSSEQQPSQRVASQRGTASRRSATRMAAALATCAAAVILLATQLWQQSDPFKKHNRATELAKVATLVVESSHKPQFAVLTRAVGVDWEDRSAAHNTGAALGNERLKFKSGAIQLEFCSGATVVLEGPADFEISSSMHAVCHSGKLRVHAPPQAHGFTVTVPGLDVVDLGTEFAIEVGQDLQSEVHVLDGEVSLQPQPSDSETAVLEQLLSHGESVKFDRIAGLAPADRDKTAFAAQNFINSERIAHLGHVERTERFQTWRTMNQDLAADPTTILHYDFTRDQAWSRTVQNHSSLQSSGLDGAIVGCRWTDGRWPGNQALDFKGTSDQVRLSIPGEYDSLTYLAWVRIDGLDRVKNSLVLTDEWQEGEPHWQLSENCELILGVSRGNETVKNPKADPLHGTDYVSPRLLGREDLGRWVLLATVYDAEAAEIRHYFDGQLRSSHPIPSLQKLRFGPTSVGNWTSGVQGYFPVRAFNGRIDELAIFSRPFSDQDILYAFEIGRP